LNGILTSLAGIIFFLGNPINKFILLSNTPLLANNSMTYFSRYTRMAIVKIIFIINIVANPFTELCPKINSITATINVVILASKILERDSSLPNFTAFSNGTPIFNWSFILSKVIIDASTAIPIPNNMAAIPGNVNVPCIR